MKNEKEDHPLPCAGRADRRHVRRPDLPEQHAGLWEVRFSEALCILPYFTGAAVPGLTVGCVLANILTGCPLWDVVFGSLATLIGAYIARLLHKKSWWLAPWPNIIANTIAVPLILRYVYTDVSSTYPALVGLIFASEVVSAGLLGYVLLRALKPHTQLFRGA